MFVAKRGSGLFKKWGDIIRHRGRQSFLGHFQREKGAKKYMKELTWPMVKETTDAAHHILIAVENDKANPLRNVNAGLPIRGWAMLWTDDDGSDEGDQTGDDDDRMGDDEGDRTGGDSEVTWQLTICAPGCVVAVLDEVKRIARAERCSRIQLDVQNRDSVLGWDFVSRHGFELQPRTGFALDIVLDLPTPTRPTKSAAEEVSMANVAIAKIDTLMNEAAALITETMSVCDDVVTSPKAAADADVPEALAILRQSGSAL